MERRKVNVPKVIEVLENKTATQIAEIERRYFDFEKQTTLRDDLFGVGQSGRQSSMTADQRERITALLKGTKGEPIPARVLEDLKKYPPAVAGPIRAALQEKSDAAAALNQLEADAGELHELFADKLDGAQLERVMAMHRRPGKEIAPHFATWLIVTTSGKSMVGMLVHEEATGEQTYVDQKGELTLFKPGEIESRQAQSISIMPDGLPQSMTVQEFRDLLAFLQSQGKGN